MVIRVNPKYHSLGAQRSDELGQPKISSSTVHFTGSNGLPKQASPGGDRTIRQFFYNFFACVVRKFRLRIFDSKEQILNQISVVCSGDRETEIRDDETQEPPRLQTWQPKVFNPDGMPVAPRTVRKQLAQG